MVFVKVRETYDLHTVTNKMSVIGIHTPNAGIIKRNYPGLLMQCKAYRPVSCDVRVACASMLPADPQQIGLTEGDIAPEDLFNPILYKALSNQGMSQVEARIASMGSGSVNLSIDGDTADAKLDGMLGDTLTDEFNLYYGLLSDTNAWRHANPQAGLEMRGLKPLVYNMLYTVGDNRGVYSTGSSTEAGSFAAPAEDGSRLTPYGYMFKGRPEPMPMLNCTSYNAGTSHIGFSDDSIMNAEGVVPAPLVYVGAIIVPPSRLHQLFYRMVVEWTLEFSKVRSINEITNWTGIQTIGSETHYQSYDYSTTSKISGVETTQTSDTEMVSANVDVKKVM